MKRAISKDMAPVRWHPSMSFEWKQWKQTNSHRHDRQKAIIINCNDFIHSHVGHVNIRLNRLGVLSHDKKQHQRGATGPRERWEPILGCWGGSVVAFEV